MARSPISRSFNRLSPEALARAFETDGYVVISRLLSARAVRSAQAAAAQVLRTRSPSVPIGWLLALHMPPRAQRWVRRIALDPAVLRAIGALVGESVALVSAQLFVKAADDGTTAVPWHQDAASGGCTTTLWLALDDILADGSNGGLVVLPRQHKRGVLPSMPECAVASTFDAIAEADLPGHGSTRQAYALRAGGCGVHGPLTPHMSTPNTSGRRRRVLVLRYAGAARLQRKGEALWRAGPGMGTVDGGDDDVVVETGRHSRFQDVSWVTGEPVDRRCYVG